MARRLRRGERRDSHVALLLTAHRDHNSMPACLVSIGGTDHIFDRPSNQHATWLARG
eukprot:CAMPEP_0117589676 /NCGR_PEP_ID=MMETSP0784-20121206/70544_1 /TAXON_ID=39447 /ORGANISM="" /LENGTH=56 /DNA_ID=CAMNT_0005391183 /DNA_START=79 /DNA_END=245 /DNA_ORIENTATION=-